jgi:hypothetical protein
MLLAFLFVPVPSFLGVQALTSPCCYAAYVLLQGSRIPAGPQLGLPLMIYLGLFFLLSGVSFKISTLPRSKLARLYIQFAFLVLLFCCSFVPIIGESSWEPGHGGDSGSYNFWTACARFPHTTRR